MRASQPWGETLLITVVLDTNLFVAAGFRPRSASGRLIEAVRAGKVRMVWDEATRRETERIVRKIPPLSWDSFAGLFRAEDRFPGETHPERFPYVPDPEDRKFAALAAAAGAVLVTLDAPLLRARRDGLEIVRPGEVAPGVSSGPPG